MRNSCGKSVIDDRIYPFFSTLKSFSIDPDALPSVTEVPHVDTVSSSPVEEINPCLSEAESAHQINPCDSIDRFANPPLTLFIRQLREELMESAASLFYPNTDSNECHNSSECTTATCIPVPQEDVEDGLNTYLSSNLSRLNFEPDGTGFIDSSWDLVIDKPDLHVWRRPLDSRKANSMFLTSDKTESNGELAKSDKSSSSKYEYRCEYQGHDAFLLDYYLFPLLDSKSRTLYPPFMHMSFYPVCGTYHDVSALSFLEVQLNLSYRRHWDSRVVTLEYIQPESTNGTSPLCDLIRWVARFPFPLAQREYVYARRWWLEADKVESVSCETEREEDTCRHHAIVFSRAAQLPSIGGSNSSAVDKGSGNPLAKIHRQLKQSAVHVTTYRSEMLIQSHGRFGELGMNYYLVYHDDPRLPLGDSSLSIVSGKAMNQFISNLHHAALQLVQSGLPVGMNAVVFNPSLQTPKTEPVLIASTPSPTMTSSQSPADMDPPGSPVGSKTRATSRSNFFADFSSEPAQLSTAAY